MNMVIVTHIMITQSGRYILVGKHVHLDNSVLSTNKDIYTVL